MTKLNNLVVIGMGAPNQLRDDAIGEAISWGVSAAVNIGTSIATLAWSQEHPGAPLSYTTAIGAGLGSFSAINLRNKRQDKERELERTLYDGNGATVSN